MVKHGLGIFILIPTFFFSEFDHPEKCNIFSNFLNIYRPHKEGNDFSTLATARAIKIRLAILHDYSDRFLRQ
jgi:hypothetical protein